MKIFQVPKKFIFFLFKPWITVHFTLSLYRARFLSNEYLIWFSLTKRVPWPTRSVSFSALLWQKAKKGLLKWSSWWRSVKDSARPKVHTNEGSSSPKQWDKKVTFITIHGNHDFRIWIKGTFISKKIFEFSSKFLKIFPTWWWARM